MALHKLAKLSKQKHFIDKIYFLSRVFELSSGKKRFFAKKYHFISRSKDSESLVIVLAGYQPYFWDELFRRIHRNEKQFSEPLDVCVCVPKDRDDQDLISKCESFGWSYLCIGQNLLTQAENTAIKLFPKAKFIFKVDEDMILSDYLFLNLKKGLLSAEAGSKMPIGFAGPLINLNVATSPFFLRTMDAESDYEKSVGPLFDQQHDFPNCLWNPDAGIYLWKLSVPFDKTAEIIRAKNLNKTALINVRYSIGCVLFRRKFWEDIGFFSVNETGALGGDETQMCSYCVNYMRGMLVVLDVFCGHLGYSPQKESVRKFYDEHFDLITSEKTDGSNKK